MTKYPNPAHTLLKDNYTDGDVARVYRAMDDDGCGSNVYESMEDADGPLGSIVWPNGYKCGEPLYTRETETGLEITGDHNGPWTVLAPWAAETGMMEWIIRGPQGEEQGTIDATPETVEDVAFEHLQDGDWETEDGVCNLVRVGPAVADWAGVTEFGLLPRCGGSRHPAASTLTVRLVPAE